MSTLFLANIGNRNILYKGRPYSDLSKNNIIEKGKSLREWSSDLLNSFESEKENISINILPPLLEKLHNQFDVLVLFYSNQEFHNEKDTVFEVEIIKKILQSEEKPYEILTEEIKGSVVNNNTLLQYYRNKLNYFNYKYDTPNYLICDAGGTAQCKSALKISAEFVLDQNKFQVYYVNPKGIIEKVGTDEYRSIINKEQAMVLIRRSEYSGAINILGSTLSEARNSRDFVLKLLSYLYLRKNEFFPESINQIEKFKNKEIQKHNILKSHKSQSLLGSNSDLIRLFGEDFYNKLIERLYHVRLCQQLENYSEMILKLSVFYEELLNMYVELEYGYNLYSDYFNESQRFTWDCKSGEFEMDWENTILVTDDEIKGATVPVLLEVMRTSDKEPIEKLFKIIIQFFPKDHNRRISTLRNKVAHNGLYLDKAELRRRTPSKFTQVLDELITFFKLKYEDIYQDLNDLAISTLRKN